MCQLIQKAESLQKSESVQDHLSIDSSIDKQSKPLTINDDVNNPKTVPGNLTYSQALGAKQLPTIQTDDTQKKSTGDPNPISSRKSQTKSTKKHSHNAAKSETSSKQSSSQTLTIGDSILSGI